MVSAAGRSIALALLLMLIVACGSPASPSAALSIACPANVSTRVPAGMTSANVTFVAPMVTGGRAPVSTTCVPASSTSFTVGTTPVTCTASDATADHAVCTFDVTVQPPPTLALTKFMAYGDSITEGKVTVVLPNAYTLKLAALLQARYPNQAGNITVIGEGQGGETAVDAVSTGRFNQALIANNPQVLLLMEGANDLLNGGAAAIPGAVAALDTMGSQATSQGIVVFLATIPPENPADKLGSGAPFVGTLNAAIASLATTRHWVLVDVNAAFNGDVSLIGSDGLHPTDAGYQVIAQAFFGQIVGKLELPAGP